MKTVIKTINEVPDHLRDQMRCLPVLIKFRIQFIETDGSQFVAKSGIANDLTNLFAIETIWSCICISRSIRISN